jgi:hypothetical protein
MRPVERHAYRAGFWLTIGATLVTVVLIPIGVVSIWSSLRLPVGDRSYRVTTAVKPGETDVAVLNVSAIGLNETLHQLTLQVSGSYECRAACGAAEKITFFSVRAEPVNSVGLPPSATVSMPANSGEVDATITLPVEGQLTAYPFDHYTLDLGTAVDKVGRDGTIHTLSGTAARRHVVLTIGEDIPRTTMSRPQIIHPSTVSDYGYVTSIVLSRPLYLEIITVLMVALVGMAGAYAVLLRPFDQLIINIGALVLGIWGVRSLLVGSYPPDSTAVDLALSTIILLLLLAIGVRAAVYLHRRATAQDDAGDDDAKGDSAGAAAGAGAGAGAGTGART